MNAAAGAVIEQAVSTSRFPPTFDGNPWTYGFALFSLTLVTALSLAQLLQYWFEVRARRAAEQIAANHPRAPLPLFSVVNVWRMIVSGFLLTIVFGALPDVLILLLWGDTTSSHMELLFTADRLGDGLTLLPFAASTALLAWAGQAVPQVLMRQANAPLKRPTWFMVREKLRIVGLVLAIAVLVTLAKALA